MLLQGGLVAAQIAAADSDYGNLYMLGANLGAQLLMQRYGREAELEADKYGIEYMQECRLRPARRGHAAGNLRAHERAQGQRLARGAFREPSAVAGATRRQSQACREACRRAAMTGVDRFRAAMAQTMKRQAGLRRLRRRPQGAHRQARRRRAREGGAGDPVAARARRTSTP